MLGAMRISGQKGAQLDMRKTSTGWAIRLMDHEGAPVHRLSP